MMTERFITYPIHNSVQRPYLPYVKGQQAVIPNEYLLLYLKGIVFVKNYNKGREVIQLY